MVFGMTTATGSSRNSNSKSNVLFVVSEHLVQRRSNYAFTSMLESRLDYV